MCGCTPLKFNGRFIFDTLPSRCSPCDAARDSVPVGISTGGVAERLRGDVAVFAAVFANTVTILMSEGLRLYLFD